MFFLEFVPKNPVKFEFIFRELSEAQNKVTKISLKLVIPRNLSSPSIPTCLVAGKNCRVCPFLIAFLVVLEEEKRKQCRLIIERKSVQRTEKKRMGKVEELFFILNFFLQDGLHQTLPSF